MQAAEPESRRAAPRVGVTPRRQVPTRITQRLQSRNFLSPYYRILRRVDYHLSNGKSGFVIALEPLD
jgi:hypothetical protein